MPRAPRLAPIGLPQHIVVRGNNRCTLFLDDRDRCVALRYLQEALRLLAVEVHAYVLMSNHIHLLATPREDRVLSRFVQTVGRRFARYTNRRQQRTGTLFEGRFRASLVESERYFLACMRYIELNPVRAGIAGAPGDFGWSSYAENACGDPTGIVTPHQEYLRLGRDARERAAAYRALFVPVLSSEVVGNIRSSIASNRPLRDDWGQIRI